MPHMTNLQSLSVCGHPKTETVGADLVESILGCLSLRLLDLSFKTISLEVVSLSKGSKSAACKDCCSNARYSILCIKSSDLESYEYWLQI